MKKFVLHYSRSSGVGTTMPADSITGCLSLIGHLIRQLASGEGISFTISKK